ncbi:MAG TPA: DUF6182 family protein [Mycobacteriales bacterium]|nr:DUF6182 family protein [Mycobacteriales bacterium]
MTLDQQQLQESLDERIRACRPELAGSDLASDPAAVEPESTVAVVVLRRFDPAVLVAGACAYARGLSPDEALEWRRSFTRTVFLAGDPERLAGRHRFASVSPDGSTAWTEPGPPERTEPLRRLLRAFPGTVPLADALTRDPTAAGEVELHLATAGRTLLDGIVAIHHLLAEAVLDGLIHPGDQVVLRPAPRLGAVAGPFTALRVGPDPFDPSRLTAFAGLSRPDPAPSTEESP